MLILEICLSDSVVRVQKSLENIEIECECIAYGERERNVKEAAVTCLYICLQELRKTTETSLRIQDSVTEN
jgi:hypothetical protein